MTKQQAIDWAGGVTALAECLKITAGAVSQWTEVPKDKQYDLERLSAGKLKLSAEYQLKARKVV